VELSRSAIIYVNITTNNNYLIIEVWRLKALRKTEKRKKEIMAGESNGSLAPSSTIKIPEIKFTKLFINGEFIDAVSGFSLSRSLSLLSSCVLK